MADILGMIPAHRLVQKIELFFQCRALPNMDVMSKSDPFVVCFRPDPITKRWKEYKRTETVPNTLNPDFATRIVMDFHFEEVQPLRFAVFDRDSKVEDLSKHDFIGEISSSVGEIVGSVGSKRIFKLEKPGSKAASYGILVVRAFPVDGCADLLHLQLGGQGLTKKRWFGRNDPCFTISRVNDDGTRQLVWRSNRALKTQDPVWSQATIPVQLVCNNDYDMDLVLQCWDVKANGTQKLIGEVETTLNFILQSARNSGQASAGAPFVLVPSTLPTARSTKPCGVLNVLHCRVEKQPTMLDYILGGCEISLFVAIDFTSSNGDPADPTSLHYVSPLNELNQYERVIRSVGEILMHYDSDKKVPVFGFGCYLNGGTHHCLPLTMDPEDVEVDGVSGILEAYRTTLRTVQLSGPTLMAHVVAAASREAGKYVNQDNQHYTVLLIITDGIITDMDATIAQIVEASTLPMSIVIVGVGEADFGAMKVLDADVEPLKAKGKMAARDIVQFVPFREYNNGKDAIRLATDTLEEIPGQLLSFMRHRGIVPNPPREGQHIPAPNEPFTPSTDFSTPFAATPLSPSGARMAGLRVNAVSSFEMPHVSSSSPQVNGASRKFPSPGGPTFTSKMEPVLEAPPTATYMSPHGRSYGVTSPTTASPSRIRVHPGE